MTRTTEITMIHAAECSDAEIYGSVPSSIDEVGHSSSDPDVDHLMSHRTCAPVINRKEDDVNKVVKMPSAKKSGRGPNSSSGAGDNDIARANFSYRLFLIVDLATFAMIGWLRESLEAHSYGDVVRQAVRAFALRFVENKSEAISECAQADGSPNSDEKLKRLNIRVPTQTKERLDVLKERSGMTYTDIIVCGLKLLAERAKNEEALLSTLETASQIGGGFGETVDLSTRNKRYNLAVS